EIDVPEPLDPDASVEGALFEQVVAAGGRRVNLANPVGDRPDRLGLGQGRQAFSTPSRYIGREFGRVRKLDTRLGEYPPPARTSVAPVVGVADLTDDPSQRFRVRSARPGLDVELPIDDLPLHARRERLQIGVGRGMVELDGERHARSLPSSLL